MSTISFVRRKEVRIPFDLVQHVLTQDTELHARVVQGLPAGARVVRMFLIGADPDSIVEPTAQACLVFEDESFDPVALGEPLPVMRLGVETIKPSTPPVQEREAIRQPYQCSACGAPAYIASLDFLSFPSEKHITAHLPAGRVRYGCPQHPPRKEVIISCASRQEAEDLLARPLALAARIVDAAHLGARG